MSRHCRSCGVDISDRPKNHFTCAKCYAAAARKLATGKQFIGLTCEAIGLDVARANQLIRVVHVGSPEAADATAWLVKVRDRLEKTP